MTARRGLLFGLAAAVAASFAGAAAAQDVIKIYRCQHRPTWELLPLAESTLGAAGRVAEDGGTASLILSGPAEVVARALAILAAVDVPPKTLELHYEIVDEADLEAAGVRLDGAVAGRGWSWPRSTDLRNGEISRTRAPRARAGGSEGRIAAGEADPRAHGPRGAE